MTATLIKRLVDLAILVLLLAGGLAVVGILAGHMSVTHAVQVAPPALEAIGSNATLAFDRGTLSIEGNGVLRAAAVGTALAGVALTLLALLALRRLLGRFVEGEALSEGAVADLRRIGFLLIGLAVFSVAAELAMQPLLLDTLAPPAGTIGSNTISACDLPFKTRRPMGRASASGQPESVASETHRVVPRCLFAPSRRAAVLTASPSAR